MACHLVFDIRRSDGDKRVGEFSADNHCRPLLHPAKWDAPSPPRPGGLS